MKFEDFWENSKKDIRNYSEKGKTKIGWEICKNEVLKILEDNEKYKIISMGKCELDINYKEIIKEVEKL